MPRYAQVENLIPAQTLECSVANSINTSYFCEGDWPSSNWWEVFHSEQLNFLIETALVNNFSIKEAQQRIEYATQEAIIARSTLFPSLYFKASDDWEHLSKNGLYRTLNPTIPINANLVELMLSFYYDFDFWGKNRHFFYSELSEQRAAFAEAALTQLVTATAVAQTYFALKTNLHKKQLYERLLGVKEGVANLQNLLLKKSLESRLPPLLTEENVFAAGKLVANIEQEIAVNYHQLNYLLGRGPDDYLEIEATLPCLPSHIVIPEDVSIGLLARRPDLMAQIWRVESHAHDVGAAIADFFPDINIRAMIGLESVFYSRLFQAGSATWGMKPALSLPIFTAGAIAANVRAEKAEFDEAVFAYNNLVLQSAQEVADLLVLAKSIFKQREEQTRIIESARARYQLSLLRREKGLDNLLDNYSLEVELIEQELEDLTLLYAQYVVMIKLIKALGGGYFEACIPLQAVERCG